MAIALLARLLFIALLSTSFAETNVAHARQTQCVGHDKPLMLELRNQLVSDPLHSTKLVQWNETDDCCSWEGVGCDGDGCVTSLALNNEGISGGLNESSSLFSLDYLQVLDLSYNFLSGSLPDSISNLKNMYFLDLSNCVFTGTIPSALSNLTRLYHLDLSHNFLTGSISSIHFQAIPMVEFIDLSYNSISGTIPTSLFNLISLDILDLSTNKFGGRLGEFPILNASYISYLGLSFNSLIGSIPTSVFTLPSLHQLHLSNNRFTGQIGEFPILSISSQLSIMDLSSNRLESPIPNFLFSLQSLGELYLSRNLFNDTFQLTKILKNPGLKHLDLSSNYLSLLNATTLNHFRVRQSTLERLDLSNNKIRGEVPSWIWKIGRGSLSQLNLSCNMLVNLQKPYKFPASLDTLDLHSNQLRGELPRLPKHAWYVDYSDNHFDKSIPNIRSFYPSRIGFLSVANNSLSGPFPTFICNCTNLRVLDMSVNNLSGSIPPCLFGGSFSDLNVLNLERNNISGHIPDTFSPNCSLRTLDLSHNNLVRKVPLSLVNCTSLVVMNVGGNGIEDDFPCMLPWSLQVLVLRSNRFHGEVGCQNKSWPNLQIVDMASNNFSGYLNALNFSTWRGMMLDSDAPSSRDSLGVDLNMRDYYTDVVTLTIKNLELKLFKIWPEFTSIDFSCNNFYGDIPQEIGELHSLYLLNLSQNAFGGSIPKSFGKLMQLGSLDLSMNQLTGEIPKEIARLTFLQVMNVSHNKMVGKIPIGTQMQTFSSDSFEGNTGLCGLPLKISCINTSSASLPNLGNVEPESNEIEWEYVFVAAGYAVGLGSFSWLLLFCRSFRYKYFEKIEEVFDKIVYPRHHKKRRTGGRRVGRNQVSR